MARHQEVSQEQDVLGSLDDLGVDRLSAHLEVVCSGQPSLCVDSGSTSTRLRSESVL